MKAIVLESPGDPTALLIREIDKPSPRSGWVLIKVKAFGLNCSEMFTRQGHSPSVQLPRVLDADALKANGVDRVVRVLHSSGPFRIFIQSLQDKCQHRV